MLMMIMSVDNLIYEFSANRSIHISLTVDYLCVVFLFPNIKILSLFFFLPRLND